ncbi:MAG: hypothetical protein DRI97_17490 [Bacteroidetes bacterium]|nr:MAG: hypothetical protein DRI97_17490 [Bacteroidota bacterium]RLE03491.1 MAG: hypothetical protein DRJ13_04440 [Bacteroidota bacterium]
MQVESVISNSITQDIRLKGHQSIRFAPDGFSVLISDASYTPVYLKQYKFEGSVPVEELVTECGRILDEDGLLSFEGETVLITDSMAVTLLPRQFFNVDKNREILEKICSLDKNDRVFDRIVKNRDFHMIYAVPDKIIGLGNRFAGDVKILHMAECLLSLSDQVKASDHQRGVLMAEVQDHTLDILVIVGDRVQLLNRYSLNDPSDFIYHTLNTMRQLGLDPETIPVYLSGIIHEEHPLKELLVKYIRNVISTPYYLEHLSKEQTLRYMILSEGSKCV